MDVVRRPYQVYPARGPVGVGHTLPFPLPTSAWLGASGGFSEPILQPYISLCRVPPVQGREYHAGRKVLLGGVA
jgi:hypothetical protein